MLRARTSLGLLLALALGRNWSAAAAERSPIQAELIGEFATFTNALHPDNRIGYRFHEHTPLIFGEVPKSVDPAEAARVTGALSAFTNRAGVKIFHRQVTEAGWIPQDWTFHLAPVVDGIELLLLVKVEGEGLPEFYGVQQCFRLTGTSNEAWRQKYARTPAFSEFDLWKEPVALVLPTSLTSVLLNGALRPLPAGKEAVGCRTRYGELIDRRRSGDDLAALDYIGPYRARMLWTSEAGLILRTSLDHQWSTGLFWERTTHVSDHHPADCLHAIINIGGIAPHGQQILRGKIYWLSGPGENLVEHWRGDFPGEAAKRFPGNRHDSKP